MLGGVVLLSWEKNTEGLSPESLATQYIVNLKVKLRVNHGSERGNLRVSLAESIEIPFRKNRLCRWHWWLDGIDNSVSYRDLGLGKW